MPDVQALYLLIHRQAGGDQQHLNRPLFHLNQYLLLPCTSGGQGSCLAAACILTSCSFPADSCCCPASSGGPRACICRNLRHLPAAGCRHEQLMTSLHVLLPCICRRPRAKWQLCALMDNSSPADICCCPKPAGGQDPTSNAASLQHQPSQHKAPNTCWIRYPPLPSHCRQPRHLLGQIAAGQQESCLYW